MVNVQTVEALIASSRPRRRVSGPTLALLGMSILLGALSADQSLLPGFGRISWLAPQLLMLALVAVILYRARLQRQTARGVQESLEAVQLHEWPRASATLDRLLRRPIPHSAARAESLLALAAVAEAGEAFDASQRIYECLLEEHQADPLQLHVARVSLGAAMLRTGQTTDAVDLINRLEREELPGSLRAHIELLSLFREVTMGHAVDALSRAETRRALFRRHLSTRAGYGYALLAVAYDAGGHQAMAAQAWRDATLLIPPEELIARFSQCRTVADKYPAAVLPAVAGANSGPTGVRN